MLRWWATLVIVLTAIAGAVIGWWRFGHVGGGVPFGFVPAIGCCVGFTMGLAVVLAVLIVSRILRSRRPAETSSHSS